jgi:hypothetical protein
MQGFDAYDHADAEQIGTGRWQGTPNRAWVAAFTGDDSYLTRKGCADPVPMAVLLFGRAAVSTRKDDL